MSDSDNTPFGFGRFVPGFDFLQSLAKGATSGVSPMPGLANWVAPTVSVEELEKRIGELKSVQFWLEQNSRALAATVQALEVQKMTLATLENMNVAMGDLAGTFGARMAESANAKTAKAASSDTAASRAEAKPAAASKAEEKKADAPEASAAGAAFTPGAAGLVDPVQWWTSLTNQFQQIAASAMRDVSQHAATAAPGATAAAGGAEAAQEAFKAASDMATQFAANSMKGAQELTRTAMAAGAAAVKKPAAKKAAPAQKAASTSTRSAKPRTSR